MDNLIKTELIEEFLKEKEWSKSEFCRQCKISSKTFQKIMSNDYNFDLHARGAKIDTITVPNVDNAAPK